MNLYMAPLLILPDRFVYLCISFSSSEVTCLLILAKSNTFQDKANPLATVLSAAMLLRYGLGEENAAKRIEAAVLDTLNRGFRTGDIYSSGMVSLNFCCVHYSLPFSLW